MAAATAFRRSAEMLDAIIDSQLDEHAALSVTFADGSINGAETASKFAMHQITAIRLARYLPHSR